MTDVPSRVDIDTAYRDRGFGSYTLVDVETSGLNAGRHRVLSVAALTLGADGQVTDEFYTVLDPGCDPGPVHIHGLTREKLRGAPMFEHVCNDLALRLDGRVLVAHNAQFDYEFLAREFSRAGNKIPVPHRLCTLALANRVAVPTTDIKLATLAAFYGITQARAHDALDDTRVLGGVLRALMADAARLGIPAPLLRCPPKDAVSGFPVMRTDPKVPCTYAWPGRLDHALVQGMKFAITGETRTARDALVRHAEQAGLDGTTVVSRFTSVLVTNEHDADTAKAAKARELGTPVVTEERFKLLLNDVRPGQRKDQVNNPAAVRRRISSSSKSHVTGPLIGHRILVLGGSHVEAAQARARITELGAAVSVNLSKGVTDILALDGAHSDPRMAKVRKLGLPIHGPTLLTTDEAASSCEPLTDSSSESVVLQRGQVVDLPVEGERIWTLRASWAQRGTYEVDLVAFLVDSSGRVIDDGDFVFYNQPEVHGVRLGAEGPNEQSVTVDFNELPDHCTRLVVAAALDGEGVTFSDVGAIEMSVGPGPEATGQLSSTLDAATDERSLLLTEIYLRGDAWRIRAVGQGYPVGLNVLARGYGVNVDD